MMEVAVGLEYIIQIFTDMDSPLPVALTPDPSHGDVESMEDKCHELMAATHRAESYEGLLNLPVHFTAHNPASVMVT